MHRKELHVVSTGKQDPEQLVKIIEKIHPFIDAVHIREKERTALEVFKIVESLEVSQVPLSKIIINDRVDVASAKGVEGVQLSNQSLPAAVVKKSFPHLRIGSSVHSVEEARIAEMQGADYLLFGHIFETPSKAGMTPRGTSQLKAVCEAVTIPVLAIGGIKPEDVKRVTLAGASGIAMMSGILLAESPLAEVTAYRQKLLIE
ncbi:thiamine phosphate synthase [Aquibacillus salsiterrae]|uniref:Thiamine phosphate synthase n=1 Tax=Aquibacillus salsiterrae TaxID=2950439 RepID=A0A9X4AHC8_9BACI|nr:thiamine phosphate synthase [Aquibacillus salsiterrae]MDC3418058.1 thiamine phosphate synthase [Aquibacillus salsiterrae]